MSIFFSIDIPWGKLEEHVKTYQREIVAIPGNGYCLINSITQCRTTDFKHHIKQQDVLDQIIDELYENAKLYAPFYQGTKKQMIKKAELYAEDASKVYTDIYIHRYIYTGIIDVIVCATANVIGYNLAIFQNIGGQAIIIFTQCIDKNTSNMLYLKYDYCPGFDSGNHYSTIVTKKNATLPPSMKPTPPSSMKHTTPSPTKPTPPPPNNQFEEPQEQTLENEETLNISKTK